MIRFSFDRDKFFATLYILSQGADNFDVLKAVKLLYFTDRRHLLQYGEPILGDAYIRMNSGPVPSKGYDELKAIQSGTSHETFVFADLSSKSNGGHPTFKFRETPNTEVLSESEIKTIKDVLTDLGHFSASKLIDISHGHDAWTKSEKNAPIDYSLFFAEDMEQCKDAYEVMMLEQEDRDFVDDI